MKYSTSFLLKKLINFENLTENLFCIKSLKKALAKRYNKNPPIVFPKTNIDVPSHLPKINPIIKVGKSIGVNNKFKKIVTMKKEIVRKKILLFLYFVIKSLFSLINS